MLVNEPVSSREIFEGNEFFAERFDHGRTLRNLLRHANGQPESSEILTAGRTWADVRQFRIFKTCASPEIPVVAQSPLFRSDLHRGSFGRFTWRDAV